VTYLPASSVAVFSPSAGNGLVPGGRSLAAGPGEAEFNVEGVEAPPEVADVDTDWVLAPGAGVDPPALGVPPEEELPHPASTTAVTALAAHTVSRRFDGIQSSSGPIEPWAPLDSHLGVLDEVPVDRGADFPLQAARSAHAAAAFRAAATHERQRCPSPSLNVIAVVGATLRLFFGDHNCPR